MCLPLLSYAQTEAKYLAGAVPVEDGKVVFRTEMQIGALSKANLYEAARQWAEGRFVTEGKFNARIVYADTLEGKIAVYGDEYMVFSSGALSLDRTRVNYQFQMNIEDGRCEAVLSRIRYTYHDAEKNPDKYTAEEWITDEAAMNKAQTKLLPGCAKFRRKTIDLKDELFKSLQNAFGDRLIALGIQAAPVQPADLVSVTGGNTPVRESTANLTVVPATQVVTAVETAVETPAVQAAKTVETPIAQDTARVVTRIPVTEDLPAAVTVSPHHLMVTAGDDEQFNLPESAWGGEGQLFGKHVTFIFIDTQKVAANLLLVENSGYTLSLYEEGVANPYATLSCRKVSFQTIKGTEAVKMNPALVPSKSYNMFVGEIIK
jgi:hypothetical protein